MKEFIKSLMSNDPNSASSKRAAGLSATATLILGTISTLIVFYITWKGESIVTTFIITDASLAAGCFGFNVAESIFKKDPQ